MSTLLNIKRIYTLIIEAETNDIPFLENFCVPNDRVREKIVKKDDRVGNFCMKYTNYYSHIKKKL